MPACAAGTSASASAERREAPHLRKDQSLLPRKFSGVTSTIAIACDATFRQCRRSMKSTSQNWLTANAASETTKKRAPCAPKWLFWLHERPVPVQAVVARGGDDERDRGCDVRAPSRGGGEDGEVDDVAARADDAELHQLDPVVTAAERRRRARPRRTWGEATRSATDDRRPPSSIHGTRRTPLRQAGAEWRR